MGIPWAVVVEVESESYIEIESAFLAVNLNTLPIRSWLQSIGRAAFVAVGAANWNAEHVFFFAFCPVFLRHLRDRWFLWEPL